MCALQRIEPIPGLRIEFDSSVFSAFDEFRQVGLKHEAGGILLGEYYPEKQLLRITVAVKPGQGDKRSMFGFSRCGRRSTEIAQKYWREGDGSIHFLGEWHTHPEDNPKPSLQDKISMGRQLKESTIVAPGLLLAIVGRKSVWFGYWTQKGFFQVENASSLDA